MKYVIDDQVMNELRSLQVKRAEKYILIISPVLIFVISEIAREYGSKIAYEAWLKAFVVAITFTIFRFSNSKSISKLINKISA